MVSVPVKSAVLLAVAVLAAACGFGDDSVIDAEVLELRGDRALFCTARGMETFEFPDAVPELATGSKVQIELNDDGSVAELVIVNDVDVGFCTFNGSTEIEGVDVADLADDVTPVAVPNPEG